MIGAGKLDTRCVFQKPVTAADGGGGESTTWTAQFTVWGGLSLPMMRGRMEQIAAGAVQTAVAGEMVVRDSANARLIKKEWRIVVTTDPTVSPETTETWNIRKVYPRQRDGFVRMEVEARVPT